MRRSVQKSPFLIYSHVIGRRGTRQREHLHYDGRTHQDTHPSTVWGSLEGPSVWDNMIVTISLSRPHWQTFVLPRRHTKGPLKSVSSYQIVSLRQNVQLPLLCHILVEYTQNPLRHCEIAMMKDDLRIVLQK